MCDFVMVKATTSGPTTNWIDIFNLVYIDNHIAVSFYVLHEPNVAEYLCIAIGYEIILYKSSVSYAHIKYFSMIY